MLLCLFLAACGSESSETRKQLKTKADLKGAVIGVQLGTTSDGLATELEKKGDGTKVMRQTGHDLPSLYKETSEGGLAKGFKGE